MMAISPLPPAYFEDVLAHGLGGVDAVAGDEGVARRAFGVAVDVDHRDAGGLGGFVGTVAAVAPAGM